MEEETESTPREEERKSLRSSSSSLLSSSSSLSCSRMRIKLFAHVLLVILFVAGVILSFMVDESSPISLSSVSSTLGLKFKQSQDSSGSSISSTSSISNDNDNADGDREPSESYLPDALYDLGLYQKSDFVNEVGISPPYWKPNRNDGSGRTWGPCYPLQVPSEAGNGNGNGNGNGGKNKKVVVDWYDDRNNTSFTYAHENPKDRRWKGPVVGGKAGLCRPGFIILGAGKCGTSSLYHYLLGHPRVAPAFEKQIHYFIYNLNKPIEWYYSWFPEASSFLRHGALMTGEASPGYLPYPKAAKETSERMVGNPKLIVIGRNPLTRMYSSYRYNYRVPALKDLKNGRQHEALAHQDDDYYEPFLFSFEDLVKAELKQLRNCFEGFGPGKTRSQWYKYHNWTRAEFNRREKEGLGPLIDLDNVCYGGKVNATVLREQWAELQMKNQERYIPSATAFLIQSFIGRSLYVFPLEWWYILFDSKDILFYCTEDLNDSEKLNDFSMQLGLPSFNYSEVVAQGAFNAAGHQGYDTATSWEELQEEEEKEQAISSPSGETQKSSSATSTSEGDTQNILDDGIPLSAELRKEVLDFVRPYNERLFQLVGKRCDW